MFKRISSKLIIILLLACMVLPLSSVRVAFAAKNDQSSADEEKISTNVLEQFEDEDKVTFMVEFTDKADPQKAAETVIVEEDATKSSLQAAKLNKRDAVVSELKETSDKSQNEVTEFLEKQEEKGNVDEVKSFFIVNGMAVTATKDVAEKIAEFEDVEQIVPNKTRYLHKTTNTPDASIIKATDQIEWNVERIGAPDVWEQGIDGTGVVIATIDSGVEWTHPALKEKYRGYHAETGKVDHNFNWFDAVDGESVPYDDVGHGTHVTGTMVGSEDDSKNQIGVAPGAKWIAVRAFDSTGTATDADLLEAAEWILAPTDAQGNERPDLAPDIVNNSWGSGNGLDEFYRDVVEAWVAADIFPVFSAGNLQWADDREPGSVEVPANYPESFAVGATDQGDNLADFSLLGPSPYGEVKPDVSAPGFSIRSSIPGDGYDTMNGTSMASPAVSGTVALLSQAAPGLTVEQLKTILKESAIPRTDETYKEVPNNGYGYGIIDASAAVQKAISEDGKKLKRVSGYLRYDTAIEISRNGWDSADTVILARGDDFADALTGVPLAYKLDAPILLTGNDKLYDRTLREMKRLRATNVIILGGTVAIGEEVMQLLEREGFNVRRISGDLRTDTAALVAREVTPEGSEEVIITNGYDFPDALSIASFAGIEGIPILLTMDDRIPEATNTAIKSLGAQKTLIVGGTQVIDDSIERQFPSPTRISGSDRYETNIEVIEYFGMESKKIYLATGKTYADALSGAVLAAKENSPILLVHNRIPDRTSNYIRNLSLDKLTILGGQTAVSKDIEQQLESIIGE